MASASTQSAKFTSNDRIRQLNEIDKDVARLLKSAGSAVKALTNDSATQEESSSMRHHRASFIAATSEYFSLLSRIDVRLRRQVLALEEANIISAEVAPKETPANLNVPTAFTGLGGSSAAASTAQVAKEKAGANPSGLGNLDVGWLNSRNDKVGKEMEVELWAKAQELVLNMKKEKMEAVGESDTDMEHDEVVPIFLS